MNGIACGRNSAKINFMASRIFSEKFYPAEKYPVSKHGIEFFCNKFRP
jgi:hypothetical protein